MAYCRFQLAIHKNHHRIERGTTLSSKAASDNNHNHYIVASTRWWMGKVWGSPDSPFFCGGVAALFAIARLRSLFPVVSLGRSLVGTARRTCPSRTPRARARGLISFAGGFFFFCWIHSSFQQVQGQQVSGRACRSCPFDCRRQGGASGSPCQPKCQAGGTQAFQQKYVLSVPGERLLEAITLSSSYRRLWPILEGEA
jgi:hypothetical protein